jgi:hypothetical protein
MRMNTDSAIMGMPKPKKNKTSVAQVLDVLNTGKYHYTVGEESGYAIYNYSNNRDSTISVTVASEDALKQLYHLLKKFTDITGTIYHIEYEDIPAGQNAWYNKLYAKAKADATVMAQASGNTLGELVSVEEDKNLLSQVAEEIKNAESAYIKQSFYHGDLNKRLYKRMLFKFELK